MKTFLSILLGCLMVVTAQAQTVSKDLPAFDKLVASPLIDVILIKGEHESVRIDYENVTPDKINIVAKGKTLQLYLTDAKFTTSKKDGNWKDDSYWHTLYPGAKLKAYVTYRQLKEIEIRGEQQLTVTETIKGKRLKIKLYGDNKATIASLEVDKLTVSLFGENRMDIGGGTAETQRYRAFGENKVYAENLHGETIRTSLFGESTLNLNASQRLNVTSFGESTVLNSGPGDTHKKLTIGENTVGRK